MSTPTSPSTPPSGDHNTPAGTPVAQLNFEDRVQETWTKNRSAIVGLLVVILLGILAKGGWDYYAAGQEAAIGQAFAAAKTPEQLKSFSAAHPGHALAGAAQLQIADLAYAAGKPSEAVAAYTQAAAILKTGPFASRVKLGLAMAKLAVGQTTEAETALKALAADTSETKALRTEAAYQLAVFAADSNRPDDVRTYAEQVLAIDPTSPWAQRAVAVRARTPGADTAAPSLLTVPGAK